MLYFTILCRFSQGLLFISAFYNYGLKKEFLDRYDVNEVLKENHLTAEKIVNDVL